MIEKSLNKIFPKLFLSRLKKIIKPRRKFILGLNSGFKNLKYKTLLYYKTEPFLNKRSISFYSHTNLWEITEIVKILNGFGFEVDVIDRSAQNFIPEDKYDLFIGLGSGGSGRLFDHYANSLSKAIKILYATTANPYLHNALSLKRCEEFENRTGFEPTPERVRKINFDEIIRNTDYIFSFGEKDSFSFNSYVKYNKPIFPIMPGTSPDIRFDSEWFKKRKRNHFLCFAGNGFIHKGVDLIVEAFSKMPDCHVTICGPDDDRSFFDAYGEIINNSSNISYEGFIKVGGDRFNELCSVCSYIILHSSSEGCCTSVATGMRAGLVPVINSETGINVADFGFLMTDKEKIQDIINNVQKAVNISNDEYSERVYKTLKESIKYTQGSFTQSFTLALLSVMQKEEKFR